MPIHTLETPVDETTSSIHNAIIPNIVEHQMLSDMDKTGAIDDAEDMIEDVCVKANVKFDNCLNLPNGDRDDLESHEANRDEDSSEFRGYSDLSCEDDTIKCSSDAESVLNESCTGDVKENGRYSENLADAEEIANNSRNVSLVRPTPEGSCVDNHINNSSCDDSVVSFDTLEENVTDSGVMPDRSSVKDKNVLSFNAIGFSTDTVNQLNNEDAMSPGLEGMTSVSENVEDISESISQLTLGNEIHECNTELECSDSSPGNSVNKEKVLSTGVSGDACAVEVNCDEMLRAEPSDTTSQISGSQEEPSHSVPASDAGNDVESPVGNVVKSGTSEGLQSNTESKFTDVSSSGSEVTIQEVATSEVEVQEVAKLDVMVQEVTSTIGMNHEDVDPCVLDRRKHPTHSKTDGLDCDELPECEKIDLSAVSNETEHSTYSDINLDDHVRTEIYEIHDSEERGSLSACRGSERLGSVSEGRGSASEGQCSTSEGRYSASQHSSYDSLNSNPAVVMAMNSAYYRDGEDAIVLSVLTQSEDEEDDILKIEVTRGPGSSRSTVQGTGADISRMSDSVVYPIDLDSLDEVSPSINQSSSSRDLTSTNVDSRTAACTSLDSAGFEEISLHTASVSSERSGGGGGGRFDERSARDTDTDSAEKQSSKSGLMKFFSRNLFTKKSQQHSAAVQTGDSPVDGEAGEQVLGWKLFGKVPPKQTPLKHPSEIQQDYHARHHQQQHRLSKFGASLGVGEMVKRTDKEVPSTTGLILQPRPSDLPAKDPEEEHRHQLMYHEMIDTAKRKELKDVKLRRKKREQQIRHEEILSAAVRTWNNDILPHWDTARHQKKTLDLWWNGVPPSVRGKVWKLAIGNDLNVTADLYEICIVRAKEKLKILREPVVNSDSENSSTSTSESSGNRESSVELIDLDVSRTFPQLCIFQKKGPYHELLQGLLGAYVCYRPDVGYVQGMSFLAAILLLNMEVVDTFICFANLLNKPSNVAFFSLDETTMKAYFDTYQVFFRENLPNLYSHFDTLLVTPDLYIIDWMYTMFAKSLPLDVTSRVWDVFFRDGEEFLFRTALGILRMYEDILMRMDFIHLAQFLTRLPENISGDELFRCIAQIRMLSDKQRFEQIFARSKERRVAAAAVAPVLPAILVHSASSAVIAALPPYI